jgi:hypothetical protein
MDPNNAASISLSQKCLFGEENEDRLKAICLDVIESINKI